MLLRLFFTGLLLVVSLMSCGPPGVELLQVDSDGVRLPVAIRGNLKSDRVILYQHGGPGITDFASLPKGLSLLTEAYTVISWAQRSTIYAVGNSVDSRLTIAQHVIDLRRVVGAVRHRFPNAQIWLYGHSWGVPLTLQFVSEQSASIRGLILSDGFADAPRNLKNVGVHLAERSNARIQKGIEVDYWTRVSEVAQALQQREVTLDEFGFGFQACLKLEEEEGKPEKGLPTELEPPFSRIVVPGGGQDSAVSRTIRQELNFQGYSIASRLGAIALPSLFIYGKNDPRVPEQTARDVAGALGASAKELRILDGVGHHPAGEDPEVFAAAVKEFVR